MFRYIRSYLPLKDAHIFRRVKRELRDFTNFELERLYSNQNIIDLVKMNDRIGVQYLLAHSSDIQYDDFLLRWAVYRENLEIFKYILDRNPNKKRYIGNNQSLRDVMLSLR